MILKFSKFLTVILCLLQIVELLRGPIVHFVNKVCNFAQCLSQGVYIRVRSGPQNFEVILTSF